MANTCDVCGGPRREYDPTFYSKYEVDGMKDCCEACAKDLNAAHGRITKIANELRDKWYVRFLRAYKARADRRAGH